MRIILNLSFPGNPIDRRLIFDLGNPQDHKRNRISLFLDKDHQLIALLRDNDEKQRELSVKHDITPNHSIEISCLWNKEYGVLAVLIDWQLLGKIKLDELSVAPISGTFNSAKVYPASREWI